MTSTIGEPTRSARDGAPLMSVRDLVVEYRAPSGEPVRAVSGVSFDVFAGETVGLVGESGCGKSTTARAIAQHLRATGGSIMFDGFELTTAERAEIRRLRTQIQMIFQDPVSSLNPKRVVETQLAEGLRIWKVGSKAERAERVRDVMTSCGLLYSPEQRRRRHHFSVGQCQRLSIARALVVEPRLLICDEPVSSLDVSIQAQVINLLIELKAKYGLAMLFISHDLSVVRHVSDRVIVMYLGKVCEVAPADSLYASPQHHYTSMLMKSVPVPDPDAPPPGDRGGVAAEIPSPRNPPSGCRFRTRCPRAEEVCASHEPPLTESSGGHFVACHFPIPVALGSPNGTPTESSEGGSG